VGKMNLAIVGATGLVGRTFLDMIEREHIQYDALYLFASPRSAGKTLEFQGKTYTVMALTEANVRAHQMDVALFSAGSQVSKDFAGIFIDNGALVIDNSSAFRMDKKVPLIVPEVNLEDVGNSRLIANPNCSTIQSVLPLKVVEGLSPITRVDFTTYQAVSGSGQKGLLELARTSQGEKPKIYPYPIYNNVIAQIDRFLDDGFTFEEEKMIRETQKILGKDHLAVSATCVRVPVEHAHSVSMMIETESEIDLQDLRRAFMRSDGIRLVDETDECQFPTPLAAVDQGDVLVGRLRVDRFLKTKIHLFCTADNILKGAALNAVQILKRIQEEGEIYV